jgi:hypothetical protein
MYFKVLIDSYKLTQFRFKNTFNYLVNTLRKLHKGKLSKFILTTGDKSWVRTRLRKLLFVPDGWTLIKNKLHRHVTRSLAETSLDFFLFRKLKTTEEEHCIKNSHRKHNFHVHLYRI